MTPRSVCRAILVLDLLYCVAALAVPAMPGWKMFAASERARYVLADGTGAPVAAYAWVPKAARDLDENDVTQVTRWLCRLRKVPLPLRLDVGDTHRTVDAPECLPSAQTSAQTRALE